MRPASLKSQLSVKAPPPPADEPQDGELEPIAHDGSPFEAVPAPKRTKKAAAPKKKKASR